MQSAPRPRPAGNRPVLVCPDKFRGSFSADQVADAICVGLARAGLSSDRFPIADGGEGTLAVVASALDHELVEVEACDAHGRELSVPVALLGGGRTALVESAAAIGHLPLGDLAPDAWSASSRGAGLAIAGAAKLGVREIFLGIGGTVTTDGGAGALEALCETGLLHRDGQARAATAPKLVALCDVRASWQQAATMFAPQKGADPATVSRLEKRLARQASRLPRDPRSQVMAGAGGGLAGGLWAVAGATLRSGAATLLDLLGFGPRMLAARAVVTGEGRIDRQTLLGKAVAEVATRARQAGVQCHAIVGENAIDPFDARILDFESLRQAGDRRAIAAAAGRLAAQLPSA